ncbi:hypothetical protein IVB30_05145 [Bradyrhizobium sp. 200]|uniref:hypothetical protein n=1 Tax=Bradyrhizobium sp. 200 TaxID=2782665 RepID=UPI001FFF8070|nr:hypothetical protein [Bradyrhizobium sp. 200]UPJ50790.1 hypothetical protein IVB30_05145 [Bradyrhizobium sp. 200]
MTDAELVAALDKLKDTMTSVATGGPQIQRVENSFVSLFDQVAVELRGRGIETALPYRSLWDWYGRWSQGDLPTYQMRRQFINDAFAPIINRVRDKPGQQYEPTGWTRVDRTVMEMRTRLAGAKTEEQFQSVGLLGRELLISAAQEVFDKDRHPTLDGVLASATDAKRMLEAYIAVELGGGINEYVRKHAKAALDLAVQLQHRRTATFRDAAICVEATTSVVSLIAIMAGLRDPDG